MATDTAGTDVELNSEITVTEVWPDQFEVTVDVECGEMPVVTTYTIDRTHLQALRQQIDQALH